MKTQHLYALLFILCITTSLMLSCRKDDNDGSSGNNSNTDGEVSLMGVVLSEQKSPLAGVTLKSGNLTTTTDANGLFYIENVQVINGRYYISAVKPGYFESGWGGLALKGGRYSLRISLINKGNGVLLSGTTGGVINTNNGGRIDIPAGAFVTSTGQPYTGTVRVFSHHLSPDVDDFESLIPGGDLAAENSEGELSPLISFGMLGVELEDNSGNRLKLAPGILAQLRFPIASSQSASAPVSIPLLSFDKDAGVWKQEGSATRNGNFYEGSVSHFSWWNCDIITNPPPPTISGTVVDCNNNPLPGVTVTVNGQFIMITNAQGNYSNWVPPGTHTLQVLSSNNGGLLNSAPVTITATTGNTQVPLLTVPCNAFLTVQAINCNGANAASYGRAVWSSGFSNVLYSATGSFQFHVPAFENITIQLFNSLGFADTILFSGAVNSVTAAGNLQLCNPNGGGSGGSCTGGPSQVTDIDGNVYDVVTIGNRCWMQENLKTSRYSNGDSILLSQNFIVPSYNYYNMDTSLQSVYGNLYNLYAATDPRNLCPTGWHVSTVDDWNNSILALDPLADTAFSFGNPISTIAGGMMKTTGELQNGTGLWLSPNTNATNASGFAGLPGGWLDILNHQDIGQYGVWWCDNGNSPINEQYFVELAFFYGDVFRWTPQSDAYMSIRCVRD